MEHESGKHHHGRKHFLIYPRFQLTLIAINMAVLLAIFLFVWIQASRAFARLVELGQEIKLSPDHPFFQFLDFQSSRLYANLAIAFVAGLAVSSFVTLILSHRLAGPVVRARKYFRHIAQAGKVEHELKFRKGDFFADLPGAVNEALSVLQKKP